MIGAGYAPEALSFRHSASALTAFASESSIPLKMNGAGYGNRTRLASLGSWDITTMLIPPEKAFYTGFCDLKTVFLKDTDLTEKLQPGIKILAGYFAQFFQTKLFNRERGNNGSVRGRSFKVVETCILCQSKIAH